MRLICHRCGQSVSSEVPADTVVRAWVECPDCSKAADTREMLEFLLRQFTAANVRMDGQHQWRFRSGWPMGEAIGPTPEDAVRAAMAEEKRGKAEVEAE